MEEISKTRTNVIPPNLHSDEVEQIKDEESLGWTYHKSTFKKFNVEDDNSQISSNGDENQYNLALLIATKKNMETPLLTMGLSSRVFNSLMRSGVHTVGEAISLSLEKIYQVKNFGTSAYKEFIAKKKEIVQNIIDSTPNLQEYLDEIQPDELLNNEKLKNNLPVKINSKLYDRISNLLKGKELDINEVTDDDELFYIRRVKRAIDEIGPEICKLAFEEPKKIQELDKALRTFIDQRKRVHVIHELFNKIPEHRKTKKISFFIELFAKLNHYKDIIELFSTFEYVIDLDKRAENLSDQSDQLIIKRFLEWLSFDLDQFTRHYFEETLDRGRSKEVLVRRASGETLETISKEFNVTRERIRQIESAALAEFRRISMNLPLLQYLSADLNGETIITCDEILQISPNSNIIIYLLKKIPDDTFAYDKHFDCFYLKGSLDIEKCYEPILDLPETIMDKEKGIILENISRSKKIPRKLVDIIFRNYFKRYGEIWHLGKLNKAAMCSIIIEKYFPNGIRIYDDDEMIRFKNYLHETFGYQDFSENNRANWGTIQRACLLYDRGVYITPSQVNIPIDLLNKIERFFLKSGRTSMSFHELYDEFKEELLRKANITNRYLLQGIFNYYFGDKYYSYRDGITTDPGFKIAGEIEAFIEANSPVTTNELKKEFSGITDAMLIQNIQRLPSILLLDNGTYIHAAELNIIGQDYLVRNILSSYTKDHAVAASKLFDRLFETHADFLQRNNIHSPNTLFGVLQFMFADEFVFSRPYIGSLNTGDISKRSILLTLLNDKETVKIEELKFLCEEHHISFQQTSQMLFVLQDEYLQIDEDTLLSIINIHLSDEEIIKIKELLLENLGLDGFKSLATIDNYIFYPDVGWAWSPYLLQSIIQKYLSDVFRIINNVTTRSLNSKLIVDARLGIANYEDLVRFCVKSEHIREPFNDMISIVKWLIEKKLISEKAIRKIEKDWSTIPVEYILVDRFIPKFLRDNSFIYTDEFGKLICD